MDQSNQLPFRNFLITKNQQKLSPKARETIAGANKEPKPTTSAITADETDGPHYSVISPKDLNAHICVYQGKSVLLITSKDKSGNYYSGEECVVIKRNLSNLRIFGSKAAKFFVNFEDFDNFFHKLVIKNIVSYNIFKTIYMRKYVPIGDQLPPAYVPKPRSKKQKRIEVKAEKKIRQAIRRENKTNSETDVPFSRNTPFNIDSKFINWVKGETINRSGSQNPPQQMTSQLTGTPSYSSVLTGIPPPDFSRSGLDIKASNVKSWKHIAAVVCLYINPNCSAFVLPQLISCNISDGTEDEYELARKVILRYKVEKDILRSLMKRFFKDFCDGCPCIFQDMGLQLDEHLETLYPKDLVIEVETTVIQIEERKYGWDEIVSKTQTNVSKKAVSLEGKVMKYWVDGKPLLLTSQPGSIVYLADGDKEIKNLSVDTVQPYNKKSFERSFDDIEVRETRSVKKEISLQTDKPVYRYRKTRSWTSPHCPSTLNTAIRVVKSESDLPKPEDDQALENTFIVAENRNDRRAICCRFNIPKHSGRKCLELIFGCC